MKIPETTKELPYIQFSFDNKGNISYELTNLFWGGKNHCFISSDGTEGNSCPPLELDAYISAFKAKRVKELETEIKQLNQKIKKIKRIYK